MDFLNFNYIINRTKGIFLNTEKEWKTINKEIVEGKKHEISILIPFSILMAIGAIIGSIVFNVNNLGTGINISSIVIGINAFLWAFLGTYLSALVFNELLSNFSSEKNFNKSFSILINTLIPFYVFTFLAYILPQLSVFFTVIGLFSAYVFWLALVQLTKIKAEKRIGFFILSVMIGAVIFVVLKYLLGSIYLLFSGALTGI